MNVVTRRRRSVIVLVMGVILMTGCTSVTSAATKESQTSDADVPERATEASVAPSPSAPAEAEAAPADLSFEAGSALGVGVWDYGWWELLSQTEGFSVAAPDDGNGSFSYADDTTGCQIFFYQGSIGDLDMNQDDRTISDDFLAVMMAGTTQGVTREDVGTHAFDDRLAQYPETGTVAIRTIWGTGSDGGTWLHSARMFGAIGAGVYIAIFCPPGQDAQIEFQTVASQYLRVIVDRVEEG